jgi:dienelactone hydrolase
MMNKGNKDIKAIFWEIVEKKSRKEQLAYLEKVCGNDTDTRAQVEELMRAHEKAEDFLEAPVITSEIGISHSPLTETPGTVIGRYKLLETIGEGGMAVVYMAEQNEPIRRKVALKIIKLGMDTKSVIARFEAERQALAMMDHPNIAKVLDAGATETGRPYFVMELVHGVSITQYCNKNRLDTRQRLELLVKVCHAVQHAHQKGIIHRDIKPSNVLVTMHDDKPVPKVIDFGIAKATNQRLTEKTVFTRYAHLIGTPAYMSPEQAQMSELGVDTRTDIYSLGVLLYELLTGTTPFDAEKLRKAGYTEIHRIICEMDPLKPSTRLGTLGQTLTDIAQYRQVNPESLRKLLKGDLDWIVMKCLEKDRTRRYETVYGLIGDIERHLENKPILARSPGIVYCLQKFARRYQSRIIAAAVVAVLLFCLAAMALMYRRNVKTERVRWAKGEALPEIVTLIDQQNYSEALSLAKRARQYIPDDPVLAELWPHICQYVSITTSPAGADISCRQYAATDAAWQYLGQSPLEQAVLPQGPYRLKIEKKGFVTNECVLPHAFRVNDSIEVRLQPKEPTGEMVWVGPEKIELITVLHGQSGTVEIPEHLIDKYEVRNDEFKAFVDAGGYKNPEYWEGLDFVKDGRQLSWQEAMAEFRDRTGWPGPATWEQGAYPEGQGEHPVSGVSWFEANAYAKFTGKSLPTVHHWQQVACLTESLVIVPFSNFDLAGTAPVGSHPGMGHTGLYDMAGNVREWCLNATDDSGNLRYILGGCWGEPSYMFTEKDARSPWDRSPQNGFRCVRFKQGNESMTSKLCQPLPLSPWRDFSNLEPFSDEEFESLKALYQYDRTPLNPIIESRRDSSLFWREEKISFDAAYDGQRVTAYLFLPKAGKPPYQIVVYFPGGNAVYENTFSGPPYRALTKHIIMSGRAMLFPIYYGTYERPAARGRTWTMSDVVETPLAYRDWTIRMAKDLSRSIDYLQTRDDIDSDRIAYYGYSNGALLGSVMLAVEDRIETGIFVHGGIIPIDLPRSFDLALYAQRVKAPVLMINGREDVLLPLKISQIPLYELLGTADKDKKHKLYPGGHGAFGLFYEQIQGDVLDWLDLYLGPVDSR